MATEFSTLVRSICLTYPLSAVEVHVLYVLQPSAGAPCRSNQLGSGETLDQYAPPIKYPFYFFFEKRFFFINSCPLLTDIFVGLFELVVCIHPFAWIHSLFVSSVAYIMVWKMPRGKSPLYVFIFAMSYMSIWYVVLSSDHS